MVSHYTVSHNVHELTCLITITCSCDSTCVFSAMCDLKKNLLWSNAMNDEQFIFIIFKEGSDPNHNLKENGCMMLTAS